MTLRPSTDSVISALVREHATRQPETVAILAPGRPPLTYAGLWQQVLRVAGTLQAHGVTPSTRVAVVLRNGPDMATAFLGVAACATCAPLNPAYRAEELRFHLEDARARVIIVGEGERGPVHAVAKDLGLTVIEIAAGTGLPAGQFAVGSPSQEGASFELLSAPSDIALILHTSGTTARPKLVPLSHANLTASACSIADVLALQPTDRCLNVMPLFHIHGLVGALLASVAAGSSIVCTPGFDDHAFFDWVACFDPSWYTAVPTIHQAVVAAHARYRQVAPQHRFRFVRSSSSALPPTTFESLRALIGAPVVEAYGMTEAAHEMASNPLAGPCKAGSVGMPTGAEIAIMDASGRLPATGITGEIVIRGPGITAGYENNAGANAEAYRDGWFRTGDEGHFDANGYLYVSGRLKEIVNRGGAKISPREVDETLLLYPDVAEAAAFAVPHATLGEDLAAVLVLREGAQADESALRSFLFTRLADFKVPAGIAFVDALPRGPAGKLQRHRLYEAFGHLLSKAFVPPRTDVERSLDAIFRDVLGCGPIGVDDNFFVLGGDSLKAAQVLTRIEAIHGVALAVAQLFGNPTIAGFAAEVEAARTAADEWARVLASEVGQMSDEEVARLLAEEDAATRWTRR